MAVTIKRKSLKKSVKKNVRSRKLGNKTRKNSGHMRGAGKTKTKTPKPEYHPDFEHHKKKTRAALEEAYGTKKKQGKNWDRNKKKAYGFVSQLLHEKENINKIEHKVLSNMIKQKIETDAKFGNSPSTSPNKKSKKGTESEEAETTPRSQERIVYISSLGKPEESGDRSRTIPSVYATVMKRPWAQPGLGPGARPGPMTQADPRIVYSEPNVKDSPEPTYGNVPKETIYGNLLTREQLLSSMPEDPPPPLYRNLAQGATRREPTYGNVLSANSPPQRPSKLGISFNSPPTRPSRPNLNRLVSNSLGGPPPLIITGRPPKPKDFMGGPLSGFVKETENFLPGSVGRTVEESNYGNMPGGLFGKRLRSTGLSYSNT